MVAGEADRYDERVMLRRRDALSIALFTSCLFVGCGGGGPTASPPPTPARAAYDARFRFTVPLAAAATRRSPLYLSPATRSLAIDVVYAAATATTVVDLTPGPACSPNAAELTCTLDVPVQAEARNFAVRAYAQPGASGSLLGTATLPVPASTGQSTIDVSIVLDGVPRSVSLALAGGPFTAGSAATRQLIVTASDAAGRAIVGAGNYDVPIRLTTSDGAVTLSTRTVGGPSVTVNAVYDGTNAANTVAAASGGSGPSAFGTTLALFGPAATPAPSRSAPPTVPSPAPSPSSTASVGLTIQEHR